MEQPGPMVRRFAVTHVVMTMVLATIAVFAFATGASAQTIAFNAEVKGTGTKPQGCPNDAFLCGTADIAGFGQGEYLFFLESLQPIPGGCQGPGATSTAGSYTATVTFTLQDGSILTLNEAGVVCGPGTSLDSPGGAVSFGNPVDGTGSWTVQDGTGQFAGLTGSGTDTFHNAGAHVSATYIGTLEN